MISVQIHSPINPNHGIRLDFPTPALPLTINYFGKKSLTKVNMITRKSILACEWIPPEIPLVY
jgi:hypothetical protein